MKRRPKRADFFNGACPEWFPVLIEALHPDTQEVVWSICLKGPTFLEIPRLQALGHEVDWRVTYGDGVVIEKRFDDD